MGWTASVSMYARKGLYLISQIAGENCKSNYSRSVKPAWVILANFLSRQDPAWSIPEKCQVTVDGLPAWQAAVLAACWTRAENEEQPIGSALLRASPYLLEQTVAAHPSPKGIQSVDKLRDLLVSIAAELYALELGNDLARVLLRCEQSLASSGMTIDLERIAKTLTDRSESFQDEWGNVLHESLFRADKATTEKGIKKLRIHYLINGTLPTSGTITVNGTKILFASLHSLRETIQNEKSALDACHHRFKLELGKQDVSICITCGAVRGPRSTYGYRAIFSPRSARNNLGIDSATILQMHLANKPQQA